MTTILKLKIKRWAAQSSENWTWSREEVKSKTLPLQLSDSMHYSVPSQRPCLKRHHQGVGTGVREIPEPLISSKDSREGEPGEKSTFMASRIQLGLLVCHTEEKSHLCHCVSGTLEKSKVQCPGLVT